MVALSNAQTSASKQASAGEDLAPEPTKAAG
jgi:hypothetical protein